MRKDLIKQILVSSIASSLLSDFATAEEQERLPEDLDLNGSDCISIRLIRDYTPLSRDSLLIHASGKRSYYVRLLTPGFGLKSSFQLGTRSRECRLWPFCPPLRRPVLLRRLWVLAFSSPSLLGGFPLLRLFLASSSRG